jgi:uncharacterized protein (TIGR03437 family)
MTVTLLAQKPVITSVRNAASLTDARNLRGGWMGQGAIVAIFGSNLAGETAAAVTAPISTSLGGVTVLFNGIPAPLFYVSPSQINAQYPVLQEGDPAVFHGPLNAAVVVRTHGGESEPHFVPFSGNYAVFTLDSSGCGRAHVYNISPAGEWTLNSPDSAAVRGGAVAILGTGLGRVREPVPDGAPAPSSPPAEGWYSVPSLIFRGMSIGRRLFAGRAPGLIGVDQYNFLLDREAPVGCDLPVEIGQYQGASQHFPLSVARQPGPCQEPERSRAMLIWRKVISSGFSPSRDTDELQIHLTSRLTDYVHYFYNRTTVDFPELLLPKPTCPSLRPVVRLDAGPVEVSSPGFGPAQFQAETVEGQPVYDVRLPRGGIREGNFVARFPGKGSIGAFSTSTAIPAPIRLTTTFAPNRNWRLSDIVVRWEGGAPGGRVMVRVFTAAHTLKVDETYQPVQPPELVWGAEGRVLQISTEATRGILGFGGHPLGPSFVWEVQVFYYPSLDLLLPEQSAQGISQIGREWVYEWHFGGFALPRHEDLVPGQ